MARQMVSRTKEFIHPVSAHKLPFLMARQMVSRLRSRYTPSSPSDISMHLAASSAFTNFTKPVPLEIQNESYGNIPFFVSHKEYPPPPTHLWR